MANLDCDVMLLILFSKPTSRELLKDVGKNLGYPSLNCVAGRGLYLQDIEEVFLYPGLLLLPQGRGWLSKQRDIHTIIIHPMCGDNTR